MATELTGANARKLVPARLASVALTPRTLAAGVAICLVLAFASVIAATYNARRDEAAARTRYQDAQVLVALPPASNGALQDDLASLKAQLATAEAGIGAPTIDPSSDGLTSLLVREAGAAGLGVKGVARSDPSRATLGVTVYDVQSLHITVSGSVGQITVFLRALAADQPSLVPSLASMTTNDAGVSQADIVFSGYAPVPSPTPAPVATVRPK